MLIVAGLAGAGDPAAPLECPAPHPTASRDAIKQTEPQIREYSNLLAEQGDRIVPNIIMRLEKRRPSPKDHDPVVGRNAALSDSEKREKLAAFSSGVMKTLSRP